ncbi:MAG: hypothetical protein Q9224_001985 [Gallowayella concinna]
MAESIAAHSDASNENDDSYDDAGSYTTSIASSITEYKYEHGRRYHAYQEGRYALPNDEEEQHRMDLQYHAMRLTYGDKPFFAPVEKDMKRVLDVGTGTGIWVEDIYGIDLSPIQPRWSTPNVKYQVDDIEQPWTFPTDHFDFIHSRIMLGSLRDWPFFFTQSFKHLRPGGYIECQEIPVDARTDDNSLPENSALTAWCKLQGDAMRKIGMELVVTGDEIKNQMLEAGFVDVEVKEFKIPIGQWPKDPKVREIGAFQLVAMLEGIGGLTMALWTRFLGWKREDVEDELVKVRKEMQSKSVHSYWPTYVSLTLFSLM